MDPKVTALVYVAARAPDADENYPALAAKFPAPPANKEIANLILRRPVTRPRIRHSL
jgi:hypothetical protein